MALMTRMPKPFAKHKQRVFSEMQTGRLCVFRGHRAGSTQIRSLRPTPQTRWGEKAVPGGAPTSDTDSRLKLRRPGP